MRIRVLQENLLPAIQDVLKIVASRPSLPILSCFLLKATDKQVYCAATDLSLGIQTPLQAQVEEPGVVAIPAKIFSDYISTLDPGEIELSLEKDTLTVRAQTTKAQFQTLPATDFPLFPEKEGVEVNLEGEDFLQAIQQTVFAASIDEARPILTTVLTTFGPELRFVATDGFRLVVQTLSPAQAPTSPTTTVLIPAKAFQEVIRLATRKKTTNVRFYVSEKLKQVFCCVGEVELLMRLMEGEFPPYQKILPTEFQTQVVVDGVEFGQKLKTAMIFARESSGIVRLQIGKKELTLHSSSTSHGTQQATLPLQLLQGGDREIAFNAKYLQDFLQHLKPERVWLGMNESLKPAVFRPEGAKGYDYVVMPFRVNQ